MPKTFHLQAAPRLYTILAWLCFAELMLLFAFLYSRSIRIAFFQFDEFEFIRKGFFYELFFLKHDTTNPRWFAFQNDPIQPKVGPYIYGAALHAAGYRDIASYFRRYDHYKEGKTAQWLGLVLEDTDRLPEAITTTLPLVLIGRRVSLIFTLAMFVVAFWLFRIVGGYLYGLTALLLLGFNPLLRAHGIYAMTDTFLLFFFTSGLLVALGFLRSIERHERRLPYMLSVLFGALCALSAGVKVTGILLFMFGIIAMALRFVLPDTTVQQKKTLLVSVAIVVVTFLAVFIFLHPMLYRNTFAELLFMFTNRLEAARNHQQLFPSTAVTTRVQALQLVIRNTLHPGRYGNFEAGSMPINLVLFLAGVFLMGKVMYSSYRRTRRDVGVSIVLLWTIVVLVSIVAYLRNDWERYYLPSVVAVTLVQAYALTVFLRLFQKFLDFLIPYAVNALHSFRIV